MDRSLSHLRHLASRLSADAVAIYFDMDGVVADFNAGKRVIFGAAAPETNQRTATLSEEAKTFKARLYAHIREHPTFYADLPPVPGVLDVWAALAPLTPAVLTAAPSVFRAEPHVFEAIAGAKWRWSGQWLGLEDPSRFVCTTSAAKSLYVGHRPGRVQLLLDDRAENCAEWREAGGLAIEVRDARQLADALAEVLATIHQVDRPASARLEDRTKLPSACRATGRPGG